MFADWPRQPLQEERYGHHIAGEIFFQNLQKLLTRTDSQELADLLEMYQLAPAAGIRRAATAWAGAATCAASPCRRARRSSASGRPARGSRRVGSCRLEAPVQSGRRSVGEPAGVILIACVVLVVVLFGVFCRVAEPGRRTTSAGWRAHESDA